MLTCGLVVVVLLLGTGGAGSPLIRNARAASTLDLHVGFLQAIDNLNPFRGLEDASYVFYGLIYDFLFSVDQDGHWLPNLATSATCDASCQNWTYTIRQGVKWSDNTDFTADDVNFTINYNIQNFFQLWSYQPEVNRVVQCSAQTKPYCGAVQSGPWQVTVYFDRPFAAGLGLLVPIIQKAQWQSISASQAQYHYDNPTPIGTGPFIADPNLYNEWLNNQPLLLHKNPNYHPLGNASTWQHSGPSNIDNLYLQQFNNEATLVAAVKAGSVDLAKLTPSGYTALAGVANVAEQQDLISTQEWNEIGISQYDTPSVDKSLNPARWDVNVRRAMAMATNKDYIIKTIYQGKGVRGDSLVSPITSQWWYDPTSDPGANLTFNIQAANDLLNRSGYTVWSGGSFGNGVREAAQNIYMNITTNACSCANPTPVMKTVPAGTLLTFNMGVRQEFQQEQYTAAYLKAQWAEVGIQLNYQVMLESALSSAVYGGSLETYIWYWSGNPEPNYLLSIQSGYTLNGWSDNYWNNVTYNNLYIQQLADLNFTQRQIDVRAAEKVHYESAVYIIYIYPLGQWAYRTDRFTGWGDWVAHPYRQMDSFFGANPLFLDLQLNHPPTVPVIQGSSAITVYQGIGTNFVGNSTDIDPNEVLTWTWNWGDGTYTVHTSTSDVQGDTASHAWSATGTDSVTLSVSDGTFNVTSSPVVVTVTALGQHGWINGRVNNTAGDPLSGATVTANPGTHQNAADAQGRYNITVAAGTYDVTASASLYASKTVTRVVVSNNATAWANFTLELNRGWLQGTVKSSSGDPVSGASVLIVSGSGQQNQTTTDEKGHYNRTLSPGAYNVTVSASGYVTATKPAQVSVDQATNLDFSLQPETSTSGLSPLLLAGVAAFVVVVAVALAVFFVVRRRGRKKEDQAKIEIPKQ